MADLRAAPEVALDTEGDSLHHYPERLALLQLGLPSGDVWLVDPLALADLSPLGAVFADPRPLVVVHAGDNDLAQLKRRHGFVFAAIFDTSIAARFLGVTALGLDVLLERWLGVTLPPSRQRDDWSVRPLTEAQRAYAAADVRHLIALRRRLADELAGAGRLGWVQEECAAMAAQPALERAPDPQPYLGATGARDLSPRQLAVLRELWDLRERLALAADRPPFKILPEEALVKLARASPGATGPLGQVAGITPRVIGRWGPAILEAVARALALDDAALPRPERRPRRPVPAAVSRRVEALRHWRAGATRRFGLEPGVLLPNRLIGVIAAAGPRTVDELARVDGVRRWRAETFGAELLAAMAAS